MKKVLWAFPALILGLIVSVFIGIIPGVILRLIGLKKIGDNWIFTNGKLTAKFIFFLAGVKVEMTGNTQILKDLKESGEAVCIVCNHTSVLDIVMVMGCMNIHTGFVAKSELKWIPVANLWIMAVRSVFMDRKSLKKSVVAIKKAQKNISKGVSMFIFPEGTRSKTGEVGTFHKGSFRIATDCNARVLPVTVRGLREALENRKKLFGHYTAYVHIGELVGPVSSKDRSAVMTMTTEIEDKVRQQYSLLGQYYN
ncbi:MAG: 1-acyl-sn-glycerol-3-phosphate acyltransferase [Sphaerochaetaceae bacterium]|nr:1-acyl-sn-glycerol-3-phosphate acyltransferase [Sphaerochaetaceae bacterium]